MKRQFLIALFMLTTLSCSTTPISGKSAFLLTNSNTENRQGEEAYREILQKEKELTGTKEAKLVAQIGKRIAAVSNQSDFKWEFRLLQNDTPNAFCLPGGKVAVYTGILKYAKNEAGLATVMGHEIAHAIARHGGQRMSQAMAANVAMAGLAAIGLAKMDPAKKNLVLAAFGVGVTYGIIMPFSRAHESEADEIGLTLMARAGYDPREAVNFWDRFAKADGGKAPPEFLSTHPGSGRRRDQLQKLLPTVMPEYETSSRFGSGVNL